jgi:hypothetical protein
MNSSAVIRVLTRFSIEIGQFDNFSLHGYISVGLNLPCELSSVIVTLNGLLLLWNVLLVEARAYSHWVAVAVVLCHGVFEEILLEVVEHERVKVWSSFLNLKVSLFHFNKVQGARFENQSCTPI